MDTMPFFKTPEWWIPWTLTFPQNVSNIGPKRSSQSRAHINTTLVPPASFSDHCFPVFLPFGLNKAFLMWPPFQVFLEPSMVFFWVSYQEAAHAITRVDGKINKKFNVFNTNYFAGKQKSTNQKDLQALTIIKWHFKMIYLHSMSYNREKRNLKSDLPSVKGRNYCFHYIVIQIVYTNRLQEKIMTQIEF